MKTAKYSLVVRQFSVLVVLLVVAGMTQAGDGCCAHCGRDCDCQKTCRLVCTEKKIVTVCWTCQREDICLPGPSHPGCAHSDWVCDDCSDPDGPEAAPKLRYWRDWIPSPWAKVYTKKRLMKKTVTKTVPSYKWVVEDLCAECEANCDIAAVPEGVFIPPAPPADGAKMITVERIPEQNSPR